MTAMGVKQKSNVSMHCQLEWRVASKDKLHLLKTSWY